jgi:hypothetical protein
VDSDTRSDRCNRTLVDLYWNRAALKRSTQKRQTPMPILASETDHYAIRRNVVAAAWGTVIGMFFGLPPAIAAHSMGMPWVPYDIGVIIAGLVVGLLMAFTVEALFPRKPSSIHPPAAVLKTRSSPANARSGRSSAIAIRRRLAEEKASLDRLDAQRGRPASSRFGKTAEDRIVWSELLELELQDIDEQVNRIRSQPSMDPDTLPNTIPNKGGSHEHHNP